MNKLVPCAVGLAAALASPLATAQELVVQIEGQTRWEACGMAVAGIPDADGDGVPDLALSAPYLTVDDVIVGRVVLVSGGSWQPFAERRGNATDRFLGTTLSIVGDVNADGHADLAATHMSGYSVLSGTDLSLLHRFTNQTGTRTVAAVGDLDGDGHDDFADGDGAGYPHGKVRCISGRTKEVLLRLKKQEPGDRFGAGIASLGDLDGDQVPDFAIGAPFSDDGGMYSGWIGWYSGADGGLMRETVPGQEDLWGHQLKPAGDLDGDGKGDLLVAGDDHAVVLSGADGGELLRLDGTLPGCVSPAGDVDGDGLPDYLLGNNCETDGSYFGAVRLYSGQDGRVLHLFSHDRSDEVLGGSLGSMADVDGDGRSEVVLGYPNAPWHVSGSAGLLRVYADPATGPIAGPPHPRRR